MTQFLLATLYAPLASWGDIAVGEVRNSWDTPSRSAVLGLVAAALGLRRDEQEAHATLDRTLAVAVRVDLTGIAMVDYHTAQSVSAAAVKKHKPASRRELLACGGVSPLMSVHLPSAAGRPRAQD